MTPAICYRRHFFSVHDSPAPTRQLTPDALLNISEQSHGIFKPTTCGGDLSGITTVLVVAVLAPFRGATAVRTTVHSTPAPPGNRCRLAWRARSGAGPAATGLRHS